MLLNKGTDTKEQVCTFLYGMRVPKSPLADMYDSSTDDEEDLHRKSKKRKRMERRIINKGITKSSDEEEFDLDMFETQEMNTSFDDVLQPVFDVDIERDEDRMKAFNVRCDECRNDPTHSPSTIIATFDEEEMTNTSYESDFVHSVQNNARAKAYYTTLLRNVVEDARLSGFDITNEDDEIEITDNLIIVNKRKNVFSYIHCNISNCVL